MSEKTKQAVVIWRSDDGVEHPSQGYVVRTAYLQSDGTYWIPRPYGFVVPVKLYAHESVAQKACDKLNEKLRETRSFNDASGCAQSSGREVTA